MVLIQPAWSFDSSDQSSTANSNVSKSISSYSLFVYSLYLVIIFSLWPFISFSFWSYASSSEIPFTRAIVLATFLTLAVFPTSSFQLVPLVSAILIASSTTAGPALYAVRIFSLSSPYLSSNKPINSMAFCVASLGLYGFCNPIDLAVDGINWNNPCAPVLESISGLSPLSTKARALKKLGSLPFFTAISSIIISIGF